MFQCRKTDPDYQPSVCHRRVFNNADILNLDYTAEYDVEKVEEKGNEYFLQAKAKTKTVATID